MDRASGSSGTASLNFGFSEAQETYRRKVRAFAREVLLPERAKWDRERKTPWPMIQEGARRGLFSEAQDFVTRGILLEEVAYVDFNCALPALVATIPYELNELPGVPAKIRDTLLDKVRSGRGVVAVCFTEPGAGSDLGAIESTAVRSGDGWLINGVKNSISWADADAYVVICRTDEKARGIHGLSNFLALKDSDGVRLTKVHDDMGSRAVVRGEVRFEDVWVPEDHVIGELHNAYPMVAEFFDTNRAYIALKCIAAAQASIDETCEYTKNRRSMGRTLSQYQGISFALAEGATLLEGARLLCYKTLWMADAGIRHSKEGAMCKWWGPEIAFEIVRKCLTFHGQYGYTSELPFEQRLRDILGWQIGDGSAEVSKLLIARNIFGKDHVG